MAVPTKNQTPPTVNRSNQFGTFAHDPNHQFMAQANYPYYQDATATPVQSPVAITTVAELLNIPAAAIAINIYSAVSFRVSDQSGLAATKPYAVFPANTLVRIPIVTPSLDPTDLTGQMWVAADSSSGNLSFFFECV